MDNTMAKQEAKDKKRKAIPAPQFVYELTIELDDQQVFDQAVTVRRPSELNGIANTHAKAEVGQTIHWIAKRVI